MIVNVYVLAVHFLQFYLLSLEDSIYLHVFTGIVDIGMDSDQLASQNQELNCFKTRYI